VVTEGGDKVYKERIIAVAATLLLVLSACARPATPAPVSKFGLPDPIYIGATCEMSGDQAVVGEFLKQGVELAIKEINESGGIWGSKLAAVYLDDKADPKEAATVAQRFCSDPRIVAVIGHDFSSCSGAAAPIYDKCGLLQISMWSNNPQLTQRGYKTFFRNIPSDAIQGPEMARVMIQMLGAKKVAALTTNNDYGRGLLGAWEPAVKEMGGQIVESLFYDMDTHKDFSPEITKIKAAGAEAIAAFCNYSDGATILRWVETLGYKGHIVLSAGGCHDELIKLAGTAAEGVYGVTYFTLDTTNSVAKKYAEAFLKEYPKEGIERASTSAYPYECVYLVREAILRAGPGTAEQLRKALPAAMHQVKDFLGPTGLNNFDQNGECVGKGQTIVQVQNGKWTVVP